MNKTYTIRVDPKDGNYWNVDTGKGTVLRLTWSELKMLSRVGGITFVYAGMKPPVPSVFIDATDSHITHDCGCIVPMLFLVDGPTVCPYCGKYVAP